MSDAADTATLREKDNLKAMPYLDHAATTPMLPEAVSAMTAELGRVGNASSLHSSGRQARRVVEESREVVGAALGASPNEVIFTAGGTEADNLAVKGLYWARRKAEPRRRRLLASAVEHHAVLDAVQWLGDYEDAEIEWLPVDEYGRVHPDVLRASIARDPSSVALVTVMWANNEIGTVQPVQRLAEIAHAYEVPFHTDAVQAVGQIPVDFSSSGASALTVTGHKVGGPYGVGALLLARGTEPTPVLHGGGQERDVRSGTLDTPAIAGFAAAVRVAVERQPQQSARLAGLRDDLVVRLLEQAPSAVLSGDPGTDIEHRLPGNAHFSFPGCEGDALLMLLDAKGIECSTGSACTAGVARPSHVLLAMGTGEEQARASLRFSLGHTSGQEDVDELVRAIGPAVERARRAGLVAGSRKE